VRRETGKNILLIFSVLTAFVLVYQIWFGGYFLPNGHDYVTSGVKKMFAPIRDLFDRNSDPDFSQNLQKMLKPEKVVINRIGERRSFRYGTTGYEEGEHFASFFFRLFLIGDAKLINRETIDLDLYTSVLRGKSIYVDYGKNCDFHLLSSAICGYDQNHYAADLSVIKGYIIAQHESIGSHFYVYIKDEKSGNVYRYLAEAEDVIAWEQMDELISSTQSMGASSYSFELNFHKEQPEQETKVLFEPTILLDLMPQEAFVAKGYSLLSTEEDSHFPQEDHILNMFSVNTRSIWKYTDLNNTKVFVENNATLTLHPDGYLEYQTVQGGRGLALDEKKDYNGEYTIYQAVADVVDFVYKMSAELSPAFMEHLQLSGDLIDTSEKQGSYTIYFDYCLNGIPVLHQTATGPAHSIEATIENGYLKSYKQFTRAYEFNDAVVSLCPVINAADTLVDTLYNGEAPLDVNKISVIYLETEMGLAPYWYVRVNGENRIIE